MFTLKRQTVSLFFSAVGIVILTFTGAMKASAQGGINYSGNGGRHAIQGSIFFPSGRRVDLTGLKIRLENWNSGELTTFADSNGKFGFKNLTPGTYYIVIEQSDYYDQVRETVYIEESGGSGSRGVVAENMPRVMNVPIYLQPKREKTGEAKPGVINAELLKTPKPALEFYNKAQESVRAGKIEQAVRELEQAIKIYPQFAIALNELGNQYLQLKQLDKAIESFRVAAQLAPGVFSVRLNLGHALLEKGDLNEAERIFEEALKLNETAWQGHLWMGATQMRLRKLDRAEKELRRALELGGDNLSLPHYYLGGIYWGNRDYKRAADELEKYLKLTPDAPDAERLRATIKDFRSKPQ